MVASTRAAPLAAQAPSSAADDDRDELLGDRRLLEARLAESHQGVFLATIRIHSHSVQYYIVIVTRYRNERCGIRSIAERPQSHRQMLSFRQREGAFLQKTPDLVLPCFDAPRSFTIIDIKVIDPAAASYVNMTSKSPLHRHRALEIAGPRDYFGPSRRHPRRSHESGHIRCIHLWLPWCPSSRPH